MHLKGRVDRQIAGIVQGEVFGGKYPRNICKEK